MSSFPIGLKINNQQFLNVVVFQLYDQGRAPFYCKYIAINYFNLYESLSQIKCYSS